MSSTPFTLEELLALVSDDSRTEAVLTILRTPGFVRHLWKFIEQTYAYEPPQHVFARIIEYHSDPRARVFGSAIKVLSFFGWLSNVLVGRFVNQDDPLIPEMIAFFRHITIVRSGTAGSAARCFLEGSWYLPRPGHNHLMSQFPNVLQWFEGIGQAFRLEEDFMTASNGYSSNVIRRGDVLTPFSPDERALSIDNLVDAINSDPYSASVCGLCLPLFGLDFIPGLSGIHYRPAHIVGDVLIPPMLLEISQLMQHRPGGTHNITLVRFYTMYFFDHMTINDTGLVLNEDIDHGYENLDCELCVVGPVKMTCAGFYSAAHAHMMAMQTIHHFHLNRSNEAWADLIGRSGVTRLFDRWVKRAVSGNTS